MSFEKLRNLSGRKELESCQGLRSNRVAATALTGRRATQRSVVGVQVLSRRRRLHPCHVANVGCGAKPHSVNKTLEGRAVGDNVPKGTPQTTSWYIRKKTRHPRPARVSEVRQKSTQKAENRKKHPKLRYKIQIQKKKKKTQVNQQVAIDNVITNDNNVTNIDNIGNVMNRHMQQIDSETGEVVDGFVAYVVPKRKNGFQKEDGWQWHKMQ